jgi:hypothetical protein
MISGALLHQINRRCQSLGGQNIPFGGLPVVILSGDFYQFPPVHGISLVKLPDMANPKARYSTSSTESHLSGYKLFQKFTNIVILQEQALAVALYFKVFSLD